MLDLLLGLLAGFSTALFGWVTYYKVFLRFKPLNKQEKVRMLTDNIVHLPPRSAVLRIISIVQRFPYRGNAIDEEVMVEAVETLLEDLEIEVSADEELIREKVDECSETEDKVECLRNKCLQILEDRGICNRIIYEAPIETEVYEDLLEHLDMMFDVDLEAESYEVEFSESEFKEPEIIFRHTSDEEKNIRIESGYRNVINTLTSFVDIKLEGEKKLIIAPFVDKRSDGEFFGYRVFLMSEEEFFQLFYLLGLSGTWRSNDFMLNSRMFSFRDRFRGEILNKRISYGSQYNKIKY